MMDVATFEITKETAQGRSDKIGPTGNETRMTRAQDGDDGNVHHDRLDHHARSRWTLRDVARHALGEQNTRGTKPSQRRAMRSMWTGIAMETTACRRTTPRLHTLRSHRPAVCTVVRGGRRTRLRSGLGNNADGRAHSVRDMRNRRGSDGLDATMPKTQTRKN